MWNLLQDELGGGVWPRLLVALVDTGAKGLILMAAAGLAAAALRRNAAAARHLVWMLALCGLLILPVVSLMMPKWALPILPAIEAPAPPANATPLQPTPALQPAPSNFVPPPTDALAPTPLNATPMTALQPAPATQTAATPPAPTPNPVNIPTWVLALWFTGALLAIAPFMAGIIAVARLRRRADTFADSDLHALAACLTQTLDLKRPARLLRAPTGAMPMATGFLRPAVFLPEDALAWTEEKRRVVLLHELAHVKRRDCLTHAIARTATALHWFNPLAWLALRQLRIEREHACDDLVLAAGERPSAYAENLLEIARTLRASTVVSAAAITMAQKSQLEGRLLAVLDAARNRSVPTPRAVAGLFFIAGMTCAVIAACQFTPAAATGPWELETFASGPTAQSQERDFVATYANGLQARILGVGEPDGYTVFRVWAPDGVSLPGVPEGFKSKMGGSSSDKSGVNRRFFIEVFPVPEESDLGIKFKVEGNSVSHIIDRSQGRRCVNVQIYNIPENPGGTSLELGIAAGPWESVHGTMGPHSSANGSTFDVAYSDFFEKDGKVHVVVTHTPREGDYRLVVYDKNDTPYPTGKGSSSSVGTMMQTEFAVEDEVSASDLSYMDLQARPFEWKSISGIAMSPSEPVAEVRTEVSTIQAVVWTGMVDLSLASALPDVMEEIQQSNPPYVLYRGRREDFWRVWEQNASLANVLAVEPECHWLAESPEIGHDFVLNDAVQFPVEESLERIAHFSVSQTSHWEPDGDHAKLRFSGSASANLAHMGVRAAGAPDATVSGELAFDGTLKAGELLVYMAPMGRHLEFTPAQLIVVEAVSVPTKDAAYVRAMSDTRLWLSAGLPGLRQEVEAARAWEQLALTTPSNDQAQNIAWTSAGHVFIHPKDHHTLPLLNIVAVGRPTDWPHCWWDLAGKPVRTNPAWQDSLAGENALAIVYTLDSTQSVDLTLRGANIETRGLGSRWSSDYNDDERLLYVSDRDFANYVSAGGAVDLVARTGFGPWSEIGVIHAGETLELDGGTFRIDEVKPERARQSRLFRQDLPGKASVRGRYDFDPEWEIAVVGVDSAGNRSPVNFEFGSGLSARRENRLLALHVEMDYGEIEYLVLLKRAVAYYVISNIPTRPGAPFETNLPTKRVDADFLPNQFAPLPRSPAEEVALPTTGGSTVPLRDGISEDDAGIEDGTVALERLRPADDSIPPAVREERSTNAEDLVDERTVWGEVNRGLQAAIRLEPREGGYPIGDRIDVTILLRNAGTEIINIMTLGFLVPDTILVHDSAGNVKSTGNFKNIDISSVLSYNQIAPGQVIEIKQYPAITIVDGPIDKPDQFPWTAIAVEPGTHSIQIQTSIPPMELPDASNTPLAMYWVGPITTGKTELLILPGVTPPGLQVRWVAADWGTGLLTRVPWRDGNQPEGEPAELELLDTVLCRDADIAALEVVPGPISTQFAVRLQLRGEAIVRWGNATRGNAGKRLALVLDGKVIHAFTLLDTMAGGEMMLTGDFNRDEADSLAYAIRAANPLIADTLRVPDSATSTLGPEVEGTEADAVTQASPAKDAAVVSTAGSKDSPNSVFNHDYFNALLEDPNLLTHIAGDAITPPAAITSWGPVVNSLQAAVRFKPEKTEYQLGEKIDMEFLVRNTGPDPVEFLTSETRLFQLYLSRKISTSISVNSDLVKIRRVKLAPGEVASIDGMCNSVMLNGTRQEPEEPIGTYEEYHPNIHEVIFNLHFPDAYSNSGETAPRPGDWTGTLTTGTRPPLLTAYGAYGQAPAPAPDRQNSETGS